MAKTLYPNVTVNTTTQTTTTPDYYTVTYPSVGTGTYQINYPNVQPATYPNVQPATWISTTTGNGIGGSNGLKVHGDAEFEGDVKLSGISLKKILDKIEERLAILHPNDELEKKWDKLRDLRKQYMELEKEIKEKEQVWDILKK